MSLGYISASRVKKISKLSIILFLLCLAMLNNTSLGYADETYLKVDQITFDENRQVQVQFNQALDTSHPLDPDLFSVAYQDSTGTTKYVNTTNNKITAQYEGDHAIILTLNSTPQTVFYASGLMKIDILEDAVKSNTGEFYTVNQLEVTSAIEPYDVSYKIMVGGEELNLDNLTLSEDQIGENSVTTDVTLTVKDPVTNVAIPGLDITIKNYQHSVIATVTTDANGEATFSNLVIDGSLKYMTMLGGKTQITVIIPTGKAMIHMDIKKRPRSVTTSVYDENDTHINLTSSEFIFINYCHSYMITTTDVKKLVFYADSNDNDDDVWKCYASTKTFSLESGKIQTVPMDIDDRNQYTRIKKNKEEASTTLSAIKTLSITDNATGKQAFSVKVNNNIPQPSEVEFWLDNAQLPNEFTVAFSGKVGKTNEALYVYAPEKIFTKTVTDSFSMPNSSYLEKIYGIDQTTFGYGDNVYEYIYLKGGSLPVDMNELMYALYTSYKGIENKNLYRLYEDGDDNMIIPYRITSIVEDQTLKHLYYFEKNWEDSDSLPYEATIAMPLVLKIDKTAVAKGETLSFQFDSQSGYKLTKIKNKTTDTSSYPEVTITKGSETIAVITTGKWDTDLTTDTGVYTATITDAGSIVLDDSQKSKTFEVMPIKPDAPVIQSLTPGDKEAEISWLPVENATGYEIYTYADMTTSSAIKVLEASESQNTAIIEELTNGQTYYFRILAKSIELDSALSDAVSGKPLPPIPNAPVLNTPTLSDDKVLLSWTAVDRAENYKVYTKIEMTSSESIQVVPSTQTSLTLQNLEKGKNYFFKVAATNIKGEGAASNEIYLHYVTVPGAPENVVAEAWNGMVKLKIDQPLDNGGSALKGYQVTVIPTNEKRTFSTTSSTIVVGQLTNGQTYTFEVSAFNSVGTGATIISNAVKSLAPESNNAPSDRQDRSNSAQASVWVDGVENRIGKQNVSIQDGIKYTKLSVDEDELKKQLNRNIEKSIVTLKDSESSNVFTGTFKGSTIDLISTYKGTIEMITNFATYQLPLDAINWADYDMNHITVDIALKELEPPSEEQLKQMGIATVIGRPVEFSIQVYQDDKKIDIKKFKKFIGRTIETLENSQITTAIVYNDDGTYRSVPTEINIQSNQYTAKINSLTNSKYVLIWNPVTFSDMAGHWAKDAVNELGSRLIVGGVGNQDYDPNAIVTRAEYITALVKALGLPPIQTVTKFEDVDKDKWYSPYVFTADEFGIIEQWASVDKLQPNAGITRAEAAQLLENAFNWTTLDQTLTEDEMTQLLSSYDDYATVPTEAKKALALCIKYDIVNGRYNKIAPQDQMTRAEMATMILKFLQITKLI